jgi:fatty acid desaturase
VEFVELPPAKRGFEWPTIALAVVIYGLWFGTTLYWRELPWWALGGLGAWTIAWQMNLQHEIIHGHPTRSRLVNRALGVWPLSLWLPFETYRSSHLLHHCDSNLTDPFEDPESYYWTQAGWNDLGRFGQSFARFRSTLFGRLVFGPAFMIVGEIRMDLQDAWRDKPGARRLVAVHLAQCIPVLVWVLGVCEMPFWLYVAAFVYPGTSLGMLRSFAEHRAAPAPERRTAIVENARILGPLYLYNNLHVVHHMRGGLPWYRIPKFYKLNRAALIAHNGGLVYNSYFDVARRYLFTPHHEPLHPDWSRPAA